jgi:hypothetical protein
VAAARAVALVLTRAAQAEVPALTRAARAARAARAQAAPA